MLSAVVVMTRSVVAEPLMPCPDCGREVSRRALMCPGCGLKGEVIAKVAATLPMPRIGDVLDVDCGGKSVCALPVEMDGRRFAVLPLDPVLGASHLKLSFGGRPVEWTIPELAVDAPVVRLQVAATNMTYWTVGGNFVFDGARVKSTGSEVASVVSPLVSTNGFALAGREWEVLQPRQMKNHGRLVLKLLKGEPCDLPQNTHPCFGMIERMYRQREEQK